MGVRLHAIIPYARRNLLILFNFVNLPAARTVNDVAKTGPGLFKPSVWGSYPLRYCIDRLVTGSQDIDLVVAEQPIQPGTNLVIHPLPICHWAVEFVDGLIPDGYRLLLLHEIIDAAVDCMLHRSYLTLGRYGIALVSSPEERGHRESHCQNNYGSNGQQNFSGKRQFWCALEKRVGNFGSATMAVMISTDSRPTARIRTPNRLGGGHASPSVW